MATLRTKQSSLAGLGRSSALTWQYTLFDITASALGSLIVPCCKFCHAAGLGQLEPFRAPIADDRRLGLGSRGIRQWCAHQVLLAPHVRDKRPVAVLRTETADGHKQQADAAR